MKKILSAVLAVLMLLTVCAGALAAPVQLSAADADAQIRFIYSKLSTMKQNEAKRARCGPYHHPDGVGGQQEH